MTKSALMPTVALGILCGCLTTDLAEIDIAGFDPVLVDEDSVPVDVVKPGRTYEIRIGVVDGGGTRIDNPNHRSFALSSPNGTLTPVLVWPRSLVLESSADGFRLLESGEFRLEVGAKKKSAVSEEFRWPIDWSGPTTLDFRGEDGASGDDGRDGRSGDGGFLFKGSGNGGDGWSGKNGEEGFDGKDAVLYAFFYDVADRNVEGLGSDRMILLVDGTDGTAYLAPTGRIVIDARGGDGGDGGDGGNGGDAGRVETVNGASYTGERGTAGVGGRGGDGGNGGDIALYYSDPEILPFLLPKVGGGDRGRGGSGGFGEMPFGLFIADGGSGSDGSDGNFTALPLDPRQADAVLSLVDHPLFERLRVAGG